MREPLKARVWDLRPTQARLPVFPPVPEGAEQGGWVLSRGWRPKPGGRKRRARHQER